MSPEQPNRMVARTSRIGKLPINIPKGVTITIQAGTVNVQGAKGKLQMALPPDTSAEVTDGRVLVSSSLPGRDAARMQGLARALIANMVKGTTEGFMRTLELVGTGYRAEMKGGAIHFALGFSHPVVFPVPAGISAVVPADSKGTQIVITGADRGRTAARAFATVASRSARRRASRARRAARRKRDGFVPGGTARSAE
jgi:large subunit ribosomal protein L6